MPSKFQSLRFRATARSLQSSCCLHHLPLQLLKDDGNRDSGQRVSYVASQGVKKKGLRPQDIWKKMAVRTERPHLQDSTLLLEAGPGLFSSLRTLEARAWYERHEDRPSPHALP